MAAPRVSVIVPAYNAANTLEACLTSLRAQTLPGIELVLIDDGSTDATAHIFAAEAARAPELVRVVHQANAGRAAARNRGIAEARGEFLGFVDADDTAEPRMYELMLQRAETTGADLVACEYVWVETGTGETACVIAQGDPALYGTSVARRPELLLQPGASVCNKLIHRSLFETTGIRFPEGLDFEDLATAYRLTGDANRIELISEVLYRYNKGQPGSVMSSYDERFMHIIPALAITNDHFRQTGRFAQLREQLAVINFTHLITGRYDDLLRYGSRPVRHAFVAAAFRHLDTEFPGWRRAPAIRRAAGRMARYLVSTSEPLVNLYSDVRAEPRP